VVIWTQFHSARSAVVEVWESNLILCSYLVSHNYLVDIVEFIPVFILLENVSIQRLELRSARYGHVKSFGSVKALFVEEVEVVLIGKVADQLIGEAMQIRHNWEGHTPAAVARSVDVVRGEFKGFVVVEPIEDWVIFVLV